MDEYLIVPKRVMDQKLAQIQFNKETPEAKEIVDLDALAKKILERTDMSPWEKADLLAANLQRFLALKPQATPSVEINHFKPDDVVKEVKVTTTMRDKSPPHLPKRPRVSRFVPFSGSVSPTLAQKLDSNYDVDKDREDNIQFYTAQKRLFEPTDQQEELVPPGSHSKAPTSPTFKQRGRPRETQSLPKKRNAREAAPTDRVLRSKKEPQRGGRITNWISMY